MQWLHSLTTTANSRVNPCNSIYQNNKTQLFTLSTISNKQKALLRVQILSFKDISMIQATSDLCIVKREKIFEYIYGDNNNKFTQIYLEFEIKGKRTFVPDTRRQSKKKIMLSQQTTLTE